MITLYNFARGVRGLRLCWQCEEMGLPYRVEKVTFPPSPEYLALHPMGNVPFLVDGEVSMHESIAIMLYLASKYGPTPLLPEKNDPAFARALELLVFTEASFGAGLNTLMTAHFGAPTDHKKNWSIGVQEKLAAKQLAFLEERLGDRPFLVGDAFTLADIAVSTSMGMWKGALNKEIPPRIAAWRDRLQERPAYQRAQQAST